MNNELEKLNKLLNLLIKGTNEALASDHLSKYAGYFEQSRINLRNQAEGQKEAFIQIQRLINGDDGHFKNCETISRCNLNIGKSFIEDKDY
tara:strand:+ start:324 stop:596 length:273 start_codon:yes stop_codon:yes gene_type:complete